MALIKAGTYQFNDLITAPAGGVGCDVINFTTESLGYVVHCNALYIGEYPEMTYVVDDAPEELEQYLGSLGVTLPFPVVVVNGGEWDTASYGEGIKTVKVLEDTEVSTEFSKCFTANTVCKSLDEETDEEIEEEILFLIKKSTLTAIANSIRNKTGKTNSINTQNMPDEIMSISGGEPYLGEVEVSKWQ